jgi:hypothetical protein
MLKEVSNLILQLDDKFKITTDSSLQNLQLEKLCEVTDRQTKEVKYKYIILGYFGHSLPSLLKRYKNEVLLDTKECTLNDVLDKLNEIDRNIDKAVKQINFRMVSKDDQ